MGEIIAVRLLEEPRNYSLVTIPNLDIQKFFLKFKEIKFKLL
jgi:hypothetical protein